MDYDKLILQQDRSGLSQAEFCRKLGISYHAFNYWKRRKAVAGGSFLSVINPEAGSIELEFSGIKLKVTAETNLNLLKKLIEAVNA